MTMMYLTPWEIELWALIEKPQTVLELGAKQRMGRSYREFYEQHGCRYTSVDLNGTYGALALDLCQPLNLGQFDLVTNFGTSEHVPDQGACWRNVHDACKPGGYVISATPQPGHWPKHGRYYPTEAWYLRLAELNGYRVLRLDTVRDWRDRGIVRFVGQRPSEPGSFFVLPPDDLMFINETGTKVGAYAFSS